MIYLCLFLYFAGMLQSLNQSWFDYRKGRPDSVPAAFKVLFVLLLWPLAALLMRAFVVCWHLNEWRWHTDA